MSAYLDRYALPDKGFTDRSDAWWPAPYWDIDAGFASLLMLLTAVDAGLGACFFGMPVERPWAVGGQVVARRLLTATLAADHRASDGHKGALFLANIDRRLQSPERL